MIATTTKPRVSVRADSPSVVTTHRNANAAVNMLKIAPTSKPSMTPSPTAQPARTALNVRLRIEGLTSAAMANMFIAQDRVQVGNPQHAAEKAMVLSAAANPPRTQTQERKRSCRKRNQALKPSRNTPDGAKIFAKSTGPSSGERTHREAISKPETSQTRPRLAVPSQFKSSQKL